MKTQAHQALQTRPIWSQWKRLTRLHNVAACAMAIEATRSLSLPIIERHGVQLAGAPFTKNFKLKLSEYDDALADQNHLSEMVLVLSWSYFEIHCRSILDELITTGSIADWKEEYWKGGVGQWGSKLLAARNQAWTKVLGGELSLIEASTLRNAIAHGQKTYSQKMTNRIIDANGTPSWVVGDTIVIDFDRCEEIRASLKSYARLIEAKPKISKPKATKKK